MGRIKGEREGGIKARSEGVGGVHGERIKKSEREQWKVH